MLLVREREWWGEFTRRLATEPLWVLAGEFGVDEEDLEAALAAEPAPDGALSAPWWPEVERRIAAGASLRDTARRFGTNARRLRRNLARAGVRSGGRDIREFGVEALAPHLERLGQEPDAAIARDAGVTLESVQGERRRLGIEAFVPPPPKRARAPAAPVRMRPREAPRLEPAEGPALVVRRRGLPPRREPSRPPVSMGMGGLPRLRALPEPERRPDPARRRRRRVRRDEDDERKGA
jgi:hypothetical protein